MTEGFLGLPLADVTSLLDENHISYTVVNESKGEGELRVIRVRQMEDGVLELLADAFKTSV